MPSSSYERRSPGRLVRLAVVAVSFLALSGCQVTLRVGVDAHSDGSGLVTVTATLDRDAVLMVPDLAHELRTSDLQKAGWTVVGPAPAANGGVQVSVSKPFHNRAEAIAVLGQLSGGAPGNGPGPFDGFRIDQSHGLLTTSTTFHGVVDLTCGLRCFGDARLQQQLGGANLGLDPAQLQQRAGVILDRTFRFEVAVRLPGSLRSSNAPTQAGNGAQWQPKLGAKVELTATSRSTNTGRVVVLVLVVLAALVGVAFTLRRAIVRRRRPRALTANRRERSHPLRRVTP